MKNAMFFEMERAHPTGAQESIFDDGAAKTCADDDATESLPRAEKHIPQAAPNVGLGEGS
jgi:hypothetical protein